jgi:23S rRNA (cytosine1962-C5)-methyltransferase/23S rRNA (guanine2445-N2)-methyltransferase / 23S rRNA (guanine2069-N7)-methyltransferase
MNNPILGRLKKLYKHKAKWARKNNFQAFRLYEKDIPDFPYIVDIYNDRCLIYFKGNKKIDADKNHYPLLLEALKEVTQFDDSQIHYSERKVQGDEFKYSKESGRGLDFHVEEGELKFLIKFEKYIDTGLFLDHRPLRQKLVEEAKDLKVLNLFCYTGSLSVACAKAGADVTSVDLSNTYLNWAKDNFMLNGFDPEAHRFIKADVFQYLEKSTENGQFDIVILDPPTFSQSKSMEATLDIQRDQRQLVKGCLKLLKPEGKLYFSNNLRDFKLDQEIWDYCRVKDLTAWSIPQDFRDGKIHKLYEIKK